jgi:hypothetical protein
MNRSYFPVTVTGGVAYSANTPPIHGEIKQLRWYHVADTGQLATIELAVLPDQNDTGIGWQIYNRASANVATPFVVAPRQSTHDLSGAPDHTDTGTPAAPAPIVLAGDRLRVKVTPADTGVVIDGKLYIWHGGE